MRRFGKILGRSLLITALSAPIALTSQAEDSVGDKIKKMFVTPTPTPARKKHKHSTAKPSPTPAEEASPAEESSPSPSPSPKSKSKAKEKTKSSEESTPSETPSPTPKRSPPTEEDDDSVSDQGSTKSSDASDNAQTASLSPDAISGYGDDPEPVRKLIASALELTTRSLGYTYGSADPSNGGMDCSGFVYYILAQNGIKNPPRDSSGQYIWLRKAGKFNAVLSRNIDSFELDALKPGDLLFWCGTYTIKRDPPITHVMIYLGREKATKKRVMVGSSDGRTYQDKQRFGVSVFDFKLPKADSSSNGKSGPVFVGYGSIPGLGE